MSSGTFFGSLGHSSAASSVGRGSVLAGFQQLSTEEQVS